MQMIYPAQIDLFDNSPHGSHRKAIQLLQNELHLTEYENPHVHQRLSVH